MIPGVDTTLIKMSIYSGVVPFAVTGEDIFFLLGQEKSGMWSDFGGKLEIGETSIDCAIREAREESMGFLNINSLDTDLCISNTRASMYGYEIDYIPELPELYNNSYQYHHSVHVSMTTKFHSLDAHINKIGYLEKKQIKWISYSEYLKMKHEVRKISKPMLEDLMLLIIVSKILTLHSVLQT